MNTTTTTKPTDAGALPERDPKSGRFEKATVKPTTTTKPAVDATKPAKPAVEPAKKPTMPAKPAVEPAKKP